MTKVHDLHGADPAGSPSNVEAEQALLGIVLFDNSTYPGVSHLQPKAFAEGIHQRFWQEIGQRLNAGQAAEPLVLLERFRNDPAFSDVGGPRYLADLLDRAPATTLAPHYAQIVQDCFIRRDLIRHGAYIRARAMEPDGADSASLLGEVRRDLEAMEADTALDDASMVTAPEAAAAAIAHMEDMVEKGRVKGRMTGLRCVDRRLGGLRPGAMIVIGGRPSMGKTALARAILSGAAERSPKDIFAFLGIEMGPEEMMQRELSARSFGDSYDNPVKYQDMGRGSLTPLDIASMKAATMRVPANLVLDDCHSLGLEDVRRKVWSLRRRGPVAAVAIDYLQLMRRPAANGRNETAVIGEITSGLKLLARQSGICIVLLSQLSRQVEYRDDKRPQLSDLRESGSIEQDADAVLFPYREFYYVERAEPKKGSPEYVEWEMRCHDLRNRLDVICAKQRQGSVGTDRQAYRTEFDHIEDTQE